MALSSQLGSAERITLYDPVPLRIVRVDNMFRAQLLVESAHRPSMQQLLRQWMLALNQDPDTRRINWQLEVDPLEI